MGSREHARIVNRFNGDRTTDKILVREVTTCNTISRQARWAAKTSSDGWRPVLVGTFAALQEVGARVHAGGGWIWRDADGVEIVVEEVQP